MTVQAALGFMALGGLIVFTFCLLAWKMYLKGKREGAPKVVRKL